MHNSVDEKGISLSIRNGLYLPFMYKGRQIVIHQATWSFREKIWVDDELAVNEIGFRMASSHALDVDGDKLVVTFGYRRGMTEIFVEAQAGEDVVYELSHEVAQKATKWSLAISLLLGGLVGIAAGYLVGLLIGGS